MRLTIFAATYSVSFEVTKFSGYTDEFFIFESLLTPDTVKYFFELGLIIAQPTPGTYQLPRGLEFELK